MRVDGGEWNRLSLSAFLSIREYARANIAGIAGHNLVSFTLTFKPNCAISIEKQCYVSLLEPKRRDWRLLSHCIATFALGLSVLGVAALCSL
jgi:hypothetical protein